MTVIGWDDEAPLSPAERRRAPWARRLELYRMPRPWPKTYRAQPDHLAETDLMDLVRLARAGWAVRVDAPNRPVCVHLWRKDDTDDGEAVT